MQMSQLDQSGIPIQAQSQAQIAYLNNLVGSNEFNTFCIDCQTNRSTHANITFGTFICTDCATQHNQLNPMFMMYIKALEEVWDPFQLKIADLGGNKAFYEFMRDYDKEREPIM